MIKRKLGGLVQRKNLLRGLRCAKVVLISKIVEEKYRGNWECELHEKQKKGGHIDEHLKLMRFFVETRSKEFRSQ